MARIKHIITVTRQESDPGQSVFTYAEDELEDMLAHLRSLEEAGMRFEHRWEVADEKRDG